MGLSALKPGKAQAYCNEFVMLFIGFLKRKEDIKPDTVGEVMGAERGGTHHL